MAGPAATRAVARAARRDRSGCRRRARCTRPPFVCACASRPQTTKQPSRQRRTCSNVPEVGSQPGPPPRASCLAAYGRGMFTQVEQMTAMELVEEVHRTRPAWEAELVDLEHLLGDEDPD